MRSSGCLLRGQHVALLALLVAALFLWAAFEQSPRSTASFEDRIAGLRQGMTIEEAFLAPRVTHVHECLYGSLTTYHCVCQCKDFPDIPIRLTFLCRNEGRRLVGWSETKLGDSERMKPIGPEWAKNEIASDAELLEEIRQMSAREEL